MPAMSRRLSPFDARSVLLFAALALGGAAAVHAQAAPASPPAPSFGPAPAATPPGASKAPSPYVIGPSAPVNAAFARADANHDGQLSAQEADTLPAMGNRFKELDRNHDGFLSRQEFGKGAAS